MRMSASRISPVRGSVWLGPMAGPALGGEVPAHGRVAHVLGIEVRVLGLQLRLHRVLEADALEGLVPLEDAVHHRLAIFLGMLRSIQ
jgi:hypothetical protein